MKKIVFAGLVAVSMLGVAQQQASAWVNSRFSVGLNWDLQSGGNQMLWGAWRNGQPPGPEAFGGGGGFAGPGFSAPAPQPYYHGGAPMPQGNSPQSPFNASTSEPPYAGQFASPYQFATYPRPTYYYYPSYNTFNGR